MNIARESNIYKICRRLADAKTASQRNANRSYGVRRMRALRYQLRTGQITWRVYHAQSEQLAFIVSVLTDANIAADGF